VTRKRIAMDALDQIADGMEKKPKVVMELCGIETDANAGVKEIPSI
jgi:26S proteasome regulatory subunit (ATPase 3-interacting protein)